MSLASCVYSFFVNCFTCSILLWMDEILHHLETMVEPIVSGYLHGNHHFRFLNGGAGYRNQFTVGSPFDSLHRARRIFSPKRRQGFLRGVLRGPGAEELGGGPPRPAAADATDVGAFGGIRLRPASGFGKLAFGVRARAKQLFFSDFPAEGSSHTKGVCCLSTFLGRQFLASKVPGLLLSQDTK